MFKKIAFALLSVTLATAALASDPGSDNAADSVYDDGWTTGDNGGTGFSAWTITAEANSGVFIASSTGNGTGGSLGIDTSGDSWGMFGNSGATVSAIRPLTGILAEGNTFSLQMDNGNIQAGGTVGFGLQNSSGTNRFEFYFQGGDANYTLNIGGVESDTGIGFTDDGLTLTFTQLAADAFALSVTPNGGSESLFSGTLVASDISQVRLFNSNAGAGGPSDAFFNNIVVVPEPSSLSLLAGPALLGAWFFARRRRKS